MSNPTPWGDVAVQLAPALNYWLGTTRPDGSPHAAPVWGAVVHDVLYLYSERSTVKARNVAADPRAVVHLESGSDVVIVRGTLEDCGLPQDLPEVVRALDEKYGAVADPGDLPSDNPAFDVLYALAPVSAMTWSLTDYEGSQRRWP